MSNEDCNLDTETVEASKTNPQQPKRSIAKGRVLNKSKKSSTFYRMQGMEQLWKQSSLSLTRDKSPSHKIPQSTRFKDTNCFQKHNRQFLILQLRQNMRLDKNINFSKSIRPEHWVKGLGQIGPSPASYNCSRFLDESQYKTVEMSEPSENNSFQTLYYEQKMRSTIKGQSFTRFENKHKSYMEHAKHRLYQPENVAGHPGPGQYTTNSWASKPKSKSYSIRPTLQRFNQTKSLNPGPGTYHRNKTVELKPISRKGTFSRGQKGNRWQLNDFPSPNQYAIHRFLQQYS